MVEMTRLRSTGVCPGIWGCSGTPYTGQCFATVLQGTNMLGGTTVLHYVGRGSLVTDNCGRMECGHRIRQWLKEEVEKIEGACCERRPRCRGQKILGWTIRWRATIGNLQLKSSFRRRSKNLQTSSDKRIMFKLRKWVYSRCVWQHENRSGSSAFGKEPVPRISQVERTERRVRSWEHKGGKNWNYRLWHQAKGMKTKSEGKELEKQRNEREV